MLTPREEEIVKEYEALWNQSHLGRLNHSVVQDFIFVLRKEDKRRLVERVKEMVQKKLTNGHTVVLLDDVIRLIEEM